MKLRVNYLMDYRAIESRYAAAVSYLHWKLPLHVAAMTRMGRMRVQQLLTGRAVVNDRRAAHAVHNALENR